MNLIHTVSGSLKINVNHQSMAFGHNVCFISCDTSIRMCVKLEIDCNQNHHHHMERIHAEYRTSEKNVSKVNIFFV